MGQLKLSCGVEVDGNGRLAKEIEAALAPAGFYWRRSPMRGALGSGFGEGPMLWGLARWENGYASKLVLKLERWGVGAPSLVAGCACVLGDEARSMFCSFSAAEGASVLAKAWDQDEWPSMESDVASEVACAALRVGGFPSAWDRPERRELWSALRRGEMGEAEALLSAFPELGRERAPWGSSFLELACALGGSVEWIRLACAWAPPKERGEALAEALGRADSESAAAKAARELLACGRIERGDLSCLPDGGRSLWSLVEDLEIFDACAEGKGRAGSGV